MANPEQSSAGTVAFDVLHRLRARIRRYVALEGLGLVLALLGALFWCSLAVDYALELPSAARRAALVAALAALAGAGVWYLPLRMLRGFRQRALALVLERRFPQLGDRLITAVELSESDHAASPLTVAMLRQTRAEAEQLTRTLSLGEVFDRRPLVRSTLGATVLLVSIGGFAWASGEVFQTWFRRNVWLSEELYRRDTELELFVLADPGERVVAFRDGGYKHPRGGDLTLLARVPEGKKVPEQVQFRYRAIEHSGRGGDFMTKVGQAEFRHRLLGLHESIDLTLKGGDYAARQPYRIDVVDPPQVDRLVLHCLYPGYTGLNVTEPGSTAPARQDVPVLGTQVALPAGTDFLLQGMTNKPLQAVRVHTDGWELRFTRERAECALAASGATPLEWRELSLAESFLATDGRGFTIPCLLGISPTPDVLPESGSVQLPLRLSPDTTLRITLHDLDDIMTADPIRLTVRAIPDEPPQVETRLKGIGTAITRQATIPVVGEIQDSQNPAQRFGVTDDYGIADARFEYRVEAPQADRGAAEEFRPAPFSQRPEGRRQFAVDERFPVLPLDLTLGVRLILKVVAADGDDLTGPHVASGQPYQFQVVSDDELLALIAVKELNLRRRFEQILEEVRTTRKELLLARTRLEEVRGGETPAGAQGGTEDQLAGAGQAAMTTVERATSGIRKNANETQSVEEEFRDIRDELENNAVPDAKALLERIDGGIILPLHSINAVDYNTLDDALVHLRKSWDDRVNPIPRFEEPIDRLNATIERLEAVLAQMLKLETINEALQLLRDIIKSQEELQEKTRLERKKKLIEGLQ
ncbi:MAG: hypothetical protein ACKV0T_26675 [Planctomycetales bacterium]